MRHQTHFWVDKTHYWVLGLLEINPSLGGAMQSNIVPLHRDRRVEPALITDYEAGLDRGREQGIWIGVWGAGIFFALLVAAIWYFET